MGVVGVVVLTLGIAPQGERPLQGQPEPGPHALEQARPWLTVMAGPQGATAPGPESEAPGNSG